MPAMLEDLAIEACAKAQQLARLQRDGRAWAVVARRAAAVWNPAAEFGKNARMRRMLLWNGDEQLLALGCAAEIAVSGPGRHSIAAQEAAKLESRIAIAAAPGAPELPLLLTAMTFEDEIAPSPVWGATIPGTRLWLPRHLLWQRGGSPGWIISALEIKADDDEVECLARKLVEIEDLFQAGKSTDWPAPADTFTDLVDDAIAWIRDGVMRKVVLARAIDEIAAKPIDLVRVLSDLGAQFAREYTVYAYDLEDGSCFLGATPELLYAAQGDQVTTMGLAGSSRRGVSDGEDAKLREELLASTKERKEHQLVVEHLVGVLRSRCLPFEVPVTPQALSLSRITHLQTMIRAQLKHANYLELLGALHPTPAVCGLPTSTALHYLQRHEQLQRGLYGGVLGWWTPNQCRFVVPLRGGVVHADGMRARLFAGSGIVETSDPQAELSETELKLRLMRGVLHESKTLKAGL
jgi:isochorismate synthase